MFAPRWSHNAVCITKSPITWKESIEVKKKEESETLNLIQNNRVFFVFRFLPSSFVAEFLYENNNLSHATLTRREVRMIIVFLSHAISIFPVICVELPIIWTFSRL